MHDFGFYTALSERVAQIEGVHGIFTHTPPEPVLPFVLYEQISIKQDNPNFPSKVEIKFTLSLYSRYAGQQQIKSIATRIIQILENNFSSACVKLEKQSGKLLSDNQTRMMSLQFKAMKIL